ncbi:MAG: glutamate--tRNA ligase [Deltaproteobacteria bacterium]|nr:glutamate--tRNA ligase [Deltaproteobacteria bacterium]MCW5806759.1 glutamate--tRNA ligase [Deltaproteobacteria bacterium]
MPAPVRVRIAPSPTGDPHVGTAYIALFNYVFAKKHGGQFVLRIEDTDQTRARADSEQMIFEALRWCGLSWDEGPDVGGPYGPYRQSERSAIYRDHANILLDKGAAYRCFCTEDRLAKLRVQQQAMKASRFGYDRHCRDLDPADARARAAAGEPHVIRLKMPVEGTIAFTDMLRKEPVVREAAESDDQVLLKSDGMPTYHLANVVDDHLMKISHVVRAEEWISSTQKHVVLYDAFGWEKPQFAHMPLLRNADKSKISKRKNPVSINYYRDTGIFPQALLNFLATMGWSFGGDREKFTLDEMVSVFSWDRISLGGPVFDLAKLQHLNEQYLHEMSNEQLADALVAWRLNRDFLTRVVPLVRTRIKKLDEFLPRAEFVFTGDVDYTPVMTELRGACGQDVPAERLSAALLDFVERFEAREGFAAPALEELGRTWAEANGWKVGQAFMLLRIATTGRTASPGLFETMVVIGKEIVRRRIRQCAALLAPPKAPKAK